MSTRDTEELLRRAYAARAAEVTPQTLQRRYSSPTERPGGHADWADPKADGGGAEPGRRVVRLRPRGTTTRWLAPVAAAAALALVSLLVWRLVPGPSAIGPGPGGRVTIATGEPSDSPPVATAATSALPVPSTGTGVAGSSSAPRTLSQPSPSGEFSRDQIPWDLVGDGWVVAVWRDRLDPRAVGTLYLVSPVGARFSIGTLTPGERITDLSLDGRRALTVDPSGTTREWDLAAGSPRVLPIPRNPVPTSVSYTHPQGRALLVVAGGATRFAVDGSTQLAFPAGEADWGSGFVALADGTGYVVAGSGAGPVLVGNGTGAIARRYAAPAGLATCRPMRWWSPTVVLAACSAADGVRLVLFPLDGSPATIAGSGARVLDAWPHAGGQIGSRDSCQPPVLIGSGPRAEVTPLSAKSLAGQSITVLDVQDGRALLLGVGCTSLDDTSPMTLTALDVASGAEVALLGPGANGGTVGMALIVGRL